MWVQHSVGPLNGLASVWRARFSYLLILPTLLFLLTFNYYPAFSGLYHAFTDWTPSGHSPWVGLENFRFLMSDRFFIASFRNALILVVVSIVKTMTMPLLVAELVFNLKNRYTQYWMRTLFVVPIVLPAVVEILVWNNIYDPSIGPVERVPGTGGKVRLVAGVVRGSEGGPELGSVHRRALGQRLCPTDFLRRTHLHFGRGHRFVPGSTAPMSSGGSGTSTCRC